MNDGQIKMFFQVVARLVMIGLIGAVIMLGFFTPKAPETHHWMSWKALLEFFFVPNNDLSSYACLASYMKN